MKKKLSSYRTPLRLENSEFYLIDEFPQKNKAEWYDAQWDPKEAVINIEESSLKEAKAPLVFSLSMDFHPCPFTFNRKGYLSLFLHPDFTLLGKAKYNIGSNIQDEYLKGKWFIQNDYLYLEASWTDGQRREWKVWGWADLESGK